jgi:3-oxoacyl-[acyl-carrier protein] reductase
LTNNCTLITGASSDIGVALIKRLLLSSDTTSVLAHYHQSREGLQVIQRQFAQRMTLIQADFSQRTSVQEMAERITLHPVAIDRIVHLPALRLRMERFSKLSYTRLQEDLAVQVESILLLLQTLLPRMAALERAKVVFVLSSVVHGMPPKFMSLYTIVKYAQLGLMRALASEYAATSINVNAVSPSMVETRFLADIASVAVKMSAAGNPKRRNATTDDVISVIEFLLSSGSDYMTGVDIPVTAGSVC